VTGFIAMEKYRVILHEEAVQDINTIANYISLDNPQKAIEYVTQLQKTLKRVLSNFPRKHRLIKDYRVYTY